MTKHDILADIPDVQPLLNTADHLDIKTVEGDVSLREFLANMFSYHPTWIKNLYRIRWGFVRLLGMKQEGIPQQIELRPSDISMTPGQKMVPEQKMAFFIVDFAEDPHYWFAYASESHLTARLGIVREPTATGAKFHVVTLVHYNNRIGPLYFNVIRPFHHIVVAKMAQAGVAGNMKNGEPLSRLS